MDMVFLTAKLNHLAAPIIEYTGEGLLQIFTDFIRNNLTSVFGDEDDEQPKRIYGVRA